jgi:hypothetical protein
MPLEETAIFPGGVAGADSLFNLKNRVASEDPPVLDSALPSGGASFTVSPGGAGARLPGDSFVVSIDDEIIFVSTRSGDVCTVGSGGRGFEGTAAAAHSAGKEVDAFITARSHNQVAAEINALESVLLDVRPVSGAVEVDKANRFLLATAGVAGFTLTTPKPSGVSGKDYLFKKVDSASGIVTVDGNGGTIDGFSNWELSNENQYVWVFSDGQNWLVVANN